MTQLLITGEMRSGTTFLANWLNSQKGMVVHADMLLSLFMQGRALGIENIHQPLSMREKNVLLSNLIQEGRDRGLDFKQIVRSEEMGWHDLFQKALQVVQGNANAGLVGVKRTREEFYLSPLLKTGVKVIYCIRDPRDVVLSGKNRFAGFSLFRTVQNWQQSVTVAEALKAEPGFMLLRYEDMILKKEHTAKTLTGFLGHEVTTKVHELRSGRSASYQDNSAFGDVGKLFDPKAVYRWKAEPDSDEVRFCGHILRRELAEMGYEPGSVPSAATRKEGLVKAYRLHRRNQRLKAMLRRAFRACFGE